MNHRRAWITTALLGGSLPWGPAQAASRPAAGPALLTLSGAIGRSNRGPVDAALERLFIKHGVRFERAWAFDAAALQALPAVEIRPTLEYDAQPHRLSGPLLAQVLAAAGVPPQAEGQLVLRALDGYAVQLALADVRRWRMLLATRLDGQPLPLGGLGPQWAVFDADRLPEWSPKPLAERFAPCPWGLYHAEVRPA